jgi:hypothetical protein
MVRLFLCCLLGARVCGDLLMTTSVAPTTELLAICRKHAICEISKGWDKDVTFAEQVITSTRLIFE